MSHRLLVISLVLCTVTIQAQEVTLPPDFRQHNLTEYNSSLLSPVFSSDRNNPESVALWARWQWQTIDADPTTFFLNYTRRLNEESTAGVGFFQNNTGTFLLTGGALNYAYTLNLKSKAQIAFGINILGYSKELADERFQPDPDIGFPAIDESNSFILQLAPALRFQIDRFNIGIAAENLIDYNFTTKEKESQPTEKIYIGLASYRFPFSGATDGGTAYLQPTVYLKSIPGFDNQIGLTALFSASKFWIQAGYNNFYGISGGLGGRFFRRVSVGALMEFGTDTSLEGMDPSLEVVTAYKIGPVAEREKEITPEEELVEQQEKQKEELAAAEAKAAEKERKKQARDEGRRKNRRQRDSIAAARKREVLADSMLRQQKTLDSIAAIKQAEALAARQRVQDSIAAAEVARDTVPQQEVVVQPEEGEKYEETASADGLQPGFYLIANVFGTKKYFDKFMRTLTAQGLEPKSFYRSSNKYNYVYLKRYNTISEARKARDSQFEGRYAEQTWIFRVKAD